MRKVLLNLLKWGSVGLYLIQTLLTNESESFELRPVAKKETEEN